jgi:regulator of PEP synthase PpsR (kinase-PPPase family)
MAKKKAPRAADAHAISFLGVARKYQKAANLLYESDKTLRSPTYFMYLHTIELALKAFLRAADVPIVADGKRKHHKVTELYEECRNLGLRIGPEDMFDIRNVVVLLEGANEDQGLRYFKTKSSSMPALSWTREVVESLLQAVEPSVKKKADADGIVQGRAVRLEFTFGKPEPKD